MPVPMSRARILRQLAEQVAPQLPDWEELLAREEDAPTLLVTFINPRGVFIARRDPSYFSVLSRFDLVFADGMLMARAASRLRRERIKRISFDGYSAGRTILHVLAKRGDAVVLVGGHEDTVAKTGQTFAAVLGVNVALTVGGYFNGDRNRQDAITKILASGARRVICGMGVPLQEKFLLDLCSAGWCGVAWTCGGYLAQTAERGVNYYPKWVNKLNLRAFYRVLKEPKRMLWRYGIEYLDFFLALPALFVRARRRETETISLRTHSSDDETR